MTRRWMTGLIAGALVGALGPMLHAVAWHSGNDSGSSPLIATGAILSEQRATAHWQHGYSLEVIVRSTLDSHAGMDVQALTAGGEAEVVARAVPCWWGACGSEHVWRGSFPLPLDPRDGHVIIDPLASSAFLDVELVDEQTGEACRFGASWGTRSPGTTDASVAPSSETGRRASADAALGASRTEVQVRVHAPTCWPTDAYAIEFGLGVGEVTSETSVVADVARAHVCIQGPTRRDCLD